MRCYGVAKKRSLTKVDPGSLVVWGCMGSFCVVPGCSRLFRAVPGYPKDAENSCKVGTTEALFNGG